MRFSPTALSIAHDCERKWGYRYLDGIEAPRNPDAARGTEAHDLLERYLKGEAVELPPWLAVGVPHLPAPGTANVEGEFEFDLAGFTFTGKRDWVQLDVLPPIVGDHKTCKTFKYVKKPGHKKPELDLLKDVQACLYAADAMARTKSPTAECRWVYYLADPEAEPNAKPVTVTLTRADVEPVLERAVATAARLTKLIELGAKARDLPANYDCCPKYGGCPYIEPCTKEPLLSDQSADDVLASLAAKMKGVNPPAPPAAAAPPPPPPPKTAPPPPPPPAAKAAPPPPPPPPAAAAAAPPPPVCPPPGPPGPLVGGAVTPAAPAEGPLTKSEYLTLALGFEECAKFLRGKAAR